MVAPFFLLVVLSDQGFDDHSIASPKWLKNTPFPREEIGTRVRELKWKNERKRMREERSVVK